MEELAQRSGLAIEQIERIENNIDLPSLAPLIKIARVLGVRLCTFLDDQDENGPVVCRKSEAGVQEILSVCHRYSGFLRARVIFADVWFMIA